MQQQLDLLSSRPPRFPRARHEDPISSHEAAAAIERTGRGDAQAALALAAVRTWPGRTSQELAHLMCMDRHAMARRLPELRADNHVRREEPASDTKPCAITGKRACRWWPL